MQQPDPDKLQQAREAIKQMTPKERAELLEKIKILAQRKRKRAAKK